MNLLGLSMMLFLSIVDLEFLEFLPMYVYGSMALIYCSIKFEFTEVEMNYFHIYMMLVSMVSLVS